MLSIFSEEADHEIVNDRARAENYTSFNLVDVELLTELRHGFEQRLSFLHVVCVFFGVTIIAWKDGDPGESYGVLDADGFTELCLVGQAALLRLDDISEVLIGPVDIEVFAVCRVVHPLVVLNAELAVGDLFRRSDVSTFNIITTLVLLLNAIKVLRRRRFPVLRLGFLAKVGQGHHVLAKGHIRVDAREEHSAAFALIPLVTEFVLSRVLFKFFSFFVDAFNFIRGDLFCTCCFKRFLTIKLVHLLLDLFLYLLQGDCRLCFVLFERVAFEQCHRILDVNGAT